MRNLKIYKKGLLIILITTALLILLNIKSEFLLNKTEENLTKSNSVEVVFETSSVPEKKYGYYDILCSIDEIEDIKILEIGQIKANDICTLTLKIDDELDVIIEKVRLLKGIDNLIFVDSIKVIKNEENIYEAIIKLGVLKNKL